MHYENNQIENYQDDLETFENIMSFLVHLSRQF